VSGQERLKSSNVNFSREFVLLCILFLVSFTNNHSIRGVNVENLSISDIDTGAWDKEAHYVFLQYSSVQILKRKESFIDIVYRQIGKNEPTQQKGPESVLDSICQ